MPVVLQGSSQLLILAYKSDIAVSQMIYIALKCAPLSRACIMKICGILFTDFSF